MWCGGLGRGRRLRGGGGLGLCSLFCWVSISKGGVCVYDIWGWLGGWAGCLVQSFSKQTLSVCKPESCRMRV